MTNVKKSCIINLTECSRSGGHSVLFTAAHLLALINSFESFMIRISRFIDKVVNIALITVAIVIPAFAQIAPKKAPPGVDESFFGSFGIILGIIVVAAIGVTAIVLVRKREAASNNDVTKIPDPNVLKPGEFRMTYKEKKKMRPRKVLEPEVEVVISTEPTLIISQLPIYSFARLERSARFMTLPDSRDDALLIAIEHTQEESEEDAEVRGEELKVLAGFKTDNSISAISQMALYDLSSKLRSNAVTILAEIDHESVFETIVTACADPTREVRAAAARGLFRLNFDRAQAWTRIIESNDEGRMRQAARAAMEGDLVERSFDRLVHEDRKVVYEAYALTALLIKAGETEPVYRALATHKDEDVKLALLHVLQTMITETTFESLSELLLRYELTPNVAAKVNEVRSYSQLMSV